MEFMGRFVHRKKGHETSFFAISGSDDEGGSERSGSGSGSGSESDGDGDEEQENEGII